MDNSIINIEEMIKKLDLLRWTDLGNVGDIYYAETEYKTKNYPDDDLSFELFDVSRLCINKDGHYWFKMHYKTPKGIKDKEIYIRIYTGQDDSWHIINPQCILYLNGKTSQAFDTHHKEAKLEWDTDYDILAYFYVGVSDKDVHFVPKISMLDTKINHLYYDFISTYDVLAVNDKQSYGYAKTVAVLTEASLLLDLREPYSKAFYESVDKAISFMEEEYYGKAGNAECECFAIGHTHIDVAWVWQVKQAREKAQRSFATALNLMDRYPDFKFMSNQPQLYKFVKEDDPELYVRIKEKVKEGRWIPEGGMWVEPDGCIPSGEGFVRQFMFGKRFFKDEFGVDSKIFWMDDVFGHSPSLPQIALKCGMTGFTASRMNTGHNVFMWKGIDGSELFASKIFDYNSHASENELKTFWDSHKEKKYTNKMLKLFGYGDGGGGVTSKMLEYFKRYDKGIPGMPKVKIESPVKYFEEVRKDFDENTKKLRRTPKWTGEIFNINFAGTYTSISHIKKNNRKSEFLLQNAELSSSINSLFLNGKYPKDRINENWEAILQNHFHDVICGTSIKEVNKEACELYDSVIKDVSEINIKAIENIAKNVKTEGGYFVFNPNSFEFSGEVDVNGKKIFVENIPAMGYAVVSESKCENVKAENGVIENNLIKVTLNENGEIISVFDKEENKEVVEKDKITNLLRVYEDYPGHEDAWGVGEYYRSKFWDIHNAESVEYFNEKTRSGVKLIRKYQNSVISQNIVVYGNSKRIDFETKVDWKEEHVLLKALFPVDVRSEDFNCDIQFGFVKRPIYRSTEEEQTKFEVYAHKWVDISDYGYGVSVLSDSKYGYSGNEKELAVSLLRAPKFPDDTADMCEHKFTYSFYPHKGDFRCGKTVREGYELNNAPVAFKLDRQDGKLNDGFSFVTADKENIVTETVKKAEDGDGYILRLYDAYDMKNNVTLTFGFDLKKVYVCDMLENELSEIEVSNNQVNLDVSNFEIVTLKIK